MHRRQFLGALGTGSAGIGLAGCLSAPADDTRTTGSGADDAAAGAATGGDATTSPTGYDSSLAAQGLPPNICAEAIQDDPGIYAIDEPRFGSDWLGIDVPDHYRSAMDGDDLAAEHTVVGLETDDGRARAYPLRVLGIHEIVNDDFGGPIIVTYCPLCRSGMVAERRVRGSVTTFAVSGLLWAPERVQVAAAELDNRTFGAEHSGGEAVGVRASGNLVMYDLATGSYWSQILATGICGPETGTDLTIRPSTVATWGEWRRTHPDTDVLLPPPESETYVPDDEFVGRTPAPPES